ncbi:hypothetical protein [Epilithonimonas zeae]|uniref:hypothetical protein n=1 Tax=Epilithonimonas zeae TaxID=1416779 RepID=UPI00200DF212|nr:hypothetical protein [Epilithonimonas zeae]UQB67827.1 hypothetical protein KI430_12390 [Epilithonimonas zeae]
MSYDLYFYKRKSSSLSEEQVKDYLNKSNHLVLEENGNQWSYHNEETGVYFGIDLNEPNTDAEEIEIWDSFEDYENLNFCFTINFIRPNFFGYESFPILDEIIDDLDLYILNMQDEIDPDNPQKFEKNYLGNQWIVQNERLVKDNFETFQVDFYSKENSDYIWNYQFNRNQLQDNLNEDIFVAGYILLKNINDGKIYRICVWPNHIPIIIPPVDFIIIQKNYKKFFRNVEESGLVSIQQIESKLGKYFEDFECEIPNLKVVYQESADKIKNEFNDLKIESQINDFGNLISLDRLVNVKPQ